MAMRCIMCGSRESECVCDGCGRDTMVDMMEMAHVPPFLRESMVESSENKLRGDLEQNRSRDIAKGRSVDGSVINNNRRRTT